MRPEFVPGSLFAVCLSGSMRHVKTVCVCEFCGCHSGVTEGFVVLGYATAS
jgi:hypothetical protein